MTRKTKIGLAGVLAVVAIIAIAMKRPEIPVVTDTRPQPVRPSPIEEKLERPPVQMVEPEGVSRARAEEDSRPARAVSKVESTNWAVVAAIYRDYDAADRRAQDITASSTQKATVYPKRGEGSKYMVVLGSNLTQPQAEQLREQALNAGMPGDTYVTKLLPER